MSARIGKTFLPIGFALLAAGCGGSAAPARSPEAPAEKAAPSAGESQDAAEEAPAAGAPAPAAGYGRAPSSTKPEGEGAAQGTDIEAWSKQLEGALALSAPDCTTAWALRDRICDLAQRLCDVAGRSAEPEVAERCTDGRARCQRATTRVRASCAE